jgi:primary-amine oxidase
MAECCSCPPTEDQAHALDPLTPAEIRAAVAATRADPRFAEAVFEMVALDEPAKRQSGPRRARVNVVLPRQPGVWLLVVTLATGTIETAEHRPLARPMIQLEQLLAIEGLVRADPRFIAACARRGLHDMEQVCVDPWSAGEFGLEDEQGRRLAHTFSWLRPKPGDNYYAHPIEGLNALVDLAAWEVVRVDDYGQVPVPMTPIEYEAAKLPALRTPFKPLEVVQPEGASFTLEGRRLTWDQWSVRIGYNARESLTLHEISYAGRPIIDRASLVEMVVPYGSPEMAHWRKNVFDVGEYGIGKLANSLKLGCDCLGLIRYLDAHLCTMAGNVMTIENAICIHEEDAGILWKHFDARSGRTEVRRARRLVISSIATVGNYEYAMYWYLHTDGAVEFEVKATGIINTAACPPGDPGRYATEVAPGLRGHIHQHIFCARLDMAVDGPGNSLVECNTEQVPEGPDNPWGNAFYETETVLTTELAARRRINPATQRAWKVVNPNKLNHVGRPVGYRLEAKHAVTPFVRAESPSGRRARFVQNHLWVTPYDPTQRYPAGDFVNQSDGSGDIADYTAADRSIENTDIVLWHSFGLHHPVRTEDFPVQPCISTGFRLMPSGFFDRNPGIDLAP